MLSVIIPVFNGEKYLLECLQSLPSGAEIIVVDDGSTDNSAEIASEFGATVFKLINGGPVIARNHGLLHARGDFIMFMDADDVMVPGGTDIIMQNFDDETDGVIALRTDFKSPDSDKEFIIKESKGHGVIAGCAIFRRRAFDTVGNFDEELLCGDGFEWLLRAEKNGIKIKRINDIVCRRRLHGDNMGVRMRDQEMRDYVKIIRKHKLGGMKS